MGFVNNIRTETRNQLAKINAKNKEISDFEKKYATIYARDHFQTERGKLESEKQDVMNNAYKAVQAIVSAYKSKVEKADAFDGEMVTDDAKLLTGAFKLKTEDLESMFDRAARQNNRTMMRAVSDYVKEHIMEFPDYSRVFYSAQDKMDAADIMEKYAMNAFSRPEYSDIWLSDDYFQQITPEEIKGE